MPDSEKEPDRPGPDQPSVPQITLTAAQDADHPSNPYPPPSPHSNSPHSLSPNTSAHPSSTTTAVPSSSPPPQPPLPLTRDLLQRKNRLDKFIRHDRSPNPPVMTFNTDSNVQVDERVTAGLGITPRKRPLPLSTTTATATATAIATETATHESPPSSPNMRRRFPRGPTSPRSPHSPPSPSWPYDFTTTPSASVRDHMFVHSTTSQASTKDTKDTFKKHPPSPSSPSPAAFRKHPPYPYQYRNRYHDDHPRPAPTRRHRFAFVPMLYDAATRVVGLRAPERLPDQDDADSAPSPTLTMSTIQPESLDLKKKSHRYSGSSTYAEKRSIYSNIDEAVDILPHEHTSVGSDLPPYKIDSRQQPPPSDEKTKPLSTLPNPPPILPRHPLRGRSLRLFSASHPLRLFLWNHICCSRHIETFLLFILLLHYLLLVSIPIYENEQKTVFGAQWTHYVFVVFQTIYTLEALSKIIVYGFWISPRESIEPRTSLRLKIATFIRRITGTKSKGAPPPSKIPLAHRAYCSSFGNVLDLVSILSFWVDFGLMLHAYPYCSLFKALGAMRPLRLLAAFPGTAAILRSLEVSWDMLKEVLGFIFFFMLLFALVGLISFKGVFSRKCYEIGADGSYTVVDPVMHCSGYYNGSTVMGAYSEATQTNAFPGFHGYICENQQICLERPENNPDYGFANYDTIFNAFLNVYTFVSLELWTDLLYQNMDGDSVVVALFYCLGVYVISFVLTFFIFAVITSGFSRVRAANRVSAFTGKKKRPSQKPVQILDSPEDYIWKYEEGGHDVKGLWLRRKLIWIAQSTAFFYLGGLMVLLDIGFMCVRSVHASEETLEMLDNVETAFTFLFVVELLIRMAGALSWVHFWTSIRNKVDLFLVVVTCVIQLPMIQDSSAYKYLTIFQCMRIYRLFICLPRVRRLLVAALGNGEGFFNVVLFLCLTTALFVPIFMQLLGGDFFFIEPDETELRCDTFWETYLTLIMLYTSETWTDFLYKAMESQPHFSAVYAGIATSVYFAFARYIMAGLYIAVILENFELDDEVIKQYQIRQFIQRSVPKEHHPVQSFVDKIFGALYIKSNKKHLHVPRLPAALTATMSRQTMAEILGENRVEQPKPVAPAKPSKWSRLASRFWLPWNKERNNSTTPSARSHSNATLVEEMPDDYDRIVEEENRLAKIGTVPAMKSLGLFSTQNRIRRWCKLLVGSHADGRSERRNVFNWFIMACVLASILLVILDEPSTRLMRSINHSDTAFKQGDFILSIIFVVEIMIRVIADGLILPPKAYLRNSWNRLDFVVVLLNFTTLFAGTGDLPRALGTVRSLRILRLIRYFSGIRDVFVDLFHAFPLMLDALLLVFLVMVFFSVYGVNMLGGRLFACNDDEVSGRFDCLGEFQSDVGEDTTLNIYQPRVWALPENGLYGYDDFPIALAQLFSLSSTEGWIDSMFYAMSAPPEPDMQPQFSWNSPMIYHSIFYVVFMVISHGTLQLFVGVIIEKFKQRSGITTLTTHQRQYADLRRQLAEIKPTPKAQRPTSRIRRWCYDLVANKRGPFSRLMITAVILNICIIATEFQSEPVWLERFQDFAYLAFIVIYIVEVIIKYLGLGWVKWSKSKWNWYDALIAGSSLVLMTLRFASPDMWTLRVERYCLVFAAFRLGEGIDSLQTLYHTIRMSTPKIVRVTAVFMLVLCLFAMVFMELFGLTKYGSETHHNSNFRDYGNALLLLVRVTTGEAWNVVMMDYTVQAPNCVHSDNYLHSDCGSPGWAYFLFNFFYLICTHIFLNLFTATVISNFEYAYETRSRFTRLTKDDLRSFKYAWSEVDPLGTGYIQKEDVAKFLRQLKGRFRLAIYSDQHSIQNLQKLSRLGAPRSPDLEEKQSYASPMTVDSLPYPYNWHAVNQSLAQIDPTELQRRRKEYNMYYLEILSAETPKGISFDDVRTILSHRFLNMEDALTIGPLIQRLEKLDQLTTAYATEKARGVFLTMAQRKRYLHALWQKRNESELRRLGPRSGGTGLHLDTSVGGLKKRSPVPTIVIQDAPPSPGVLSLLSPHSAGGPPASPLSNFSFETQFGSPQVNSTSNHDGLSIHPPASPFYSPMMDDGDLSPGLASPHSPQWRFLDGNTAMSGEMAGSLMDSFHKSPWYALLNGHSDQDHPDDDDDIDK